MIWTNSDFFGYRHFQEFEYGNNGIIVTYDKGRDNDFTLKSKLISAYRKTNTDLKQLNEDLQRLKKHKSVFVSY